MVTYVHLEPINPEKMYQVAVGMDLGFGAGANEPLMAYAAAHPERIPDKDAGIPAKRIILEYFVMELWKRLPSFDIIDSDGSGSLNNQEVEKAYMEAFIN